MGSFVEVNKKSIVVRVEDRKLKRWFEDHPNSRSRRGEITSFSWGSQRRLARLLLNNDGRFRYFFTVTYRKNHRDCKISKRHIDYFLTRLRKVSGGNVGYVWVLEFQRRGAVHFHVFFVDIAISDFPGWRSLVVRRQILNRFVGDESDLEKFRFLTYLWLEITDQLSDRSAIKAATDLKRINSSGFVVSYAIKYAWKAEQKEFIGNADESTGEIVDRWVGRYWGASRSLKNERVYYCKDVRVVRQVRKWFGRKLGRKDFSGMWLLFDEALREKVNIMGGQLSRFSGENKELAS